MSVEKAYMPSGSKRAELSAKLTDQNIQKDDTLRIRYSMRGGAMDPDELKAAFASMQCQMHEMQAALAQEQLNSRCWTRGARPAAMVVASSPAAIRTC